MQARVALFSFLYSIGQITLGLLLHPYQTMQSLIQERVFVWMAAIPLYTLVVVTVLWRFILVPAVQLVFSCSTQYYFACDALSFISNTLIFFCWYWQVLLVYLLVRFRLVL